MTTLHPAPIPHDVAVAGITGYWRELPARAKDLRWYSCRVILGDEHAFDPLVARLAKRLRCITIGRRGKGYSGDAAEYSYEKRGRSAVSFALLSSR